MPNGRSGGFPIKTADLKEMVNAASADAPAGMLFNPPPNSGFRPASRDEISRLIDGCAANQLAVEEHDHSSYVIHLGDSPTLWLSVYADSPIFTALRQRHAEWQSEHPGWDGWLAF